MAERRNKRNRRKPSFFWQGVLILAPVLVLAKLGAYALWRDQRLAFHEAEVRAQELAQEAALRIWDELEASRLPAIRFDRSGNLLLPKPYEAVPTPQPLNDRDLNENQRRLWATAGEAAARSDNGRAAALYQEFLQTNPPPRFAALAHFHRGLLLEKLGQKADAAAAFASITNRYADALSEAGVSLDFLAHAHLRPKNEFVRYAIANPGPLTDAIVAQSSSVEEAGSENSARALWAEQQLLRRLANASRPFFRLVRANSVPLTNSATPVEMQTDAPPMFWVTDFETEQVTNAFAALGTNSRLRLQWAIVDQSKVRPQISFQHEHASLWTNMASAALASTVRDSQPERKWLLIRLLTTNGFALLAQSEEGVSDALREALARISKPEWLDFTISVAGRPAVTTNQLLELKFVGAGKASGRFWRRAIPDYTLPVLATGTRAERGEVAAGVTVAAVLVSRDLLLDQQKAHALWFGFVVAAAGLASILGFVSAYRAFHKQHRLAELKSNFVSGVSHELRAPIASIRLMAEGLERGKISEEGKQREYFRFIGQECRRLSSMIENVLDFARIEEGRKQYEFEPVDVAALVTQTVKLMEPYAAERGVRLIAKMDSKAGQGVASPSPPSGERIGVRGPLDAEESQPANGFVATIDGQAIQQALVNLIDNAIKHSPEGQEIIVKLGRAAGNDSPLTPALSPLRGEGEREPTLGPILCLSVEDHGRGIPASEHEKIFERFYRIGSELRRETPGVGIGLSIVKHIVEAHRGRVRVESEVGKGSRFVIELPLNGSKIQGGAK